MERRIPLHILFTWHPTSNAVRWHLPYLVQKFTEGSVCLHGAFPRILLFVYGLQRLISERELTAHGGSFFFLMFQSDRGFLRKVSTALKLVRCRLRINLLISIPEPSKSLPIKHQRTKPEDSSDFDKAEEKEASYAENMTLCQQTLLSSTVQKSF